MRTIPPQFYFCLRLPFLRPALSAIIPSTTRHLSIAMPEPVVKRLRYPGPIHPNLLPLNPLRYNPPKPAPHKKEIQMPPEAVIRTETLPEGYRLTTTGTELRIEATDQCP